MHFHCKYCAAGCRFKTLEGCLRCNVFLHLDNKCLDTYHKRQHLDIKHPRKLPRPESVKDSDRETRSDLLLGVSNITAL
eukprot:11502706-Ditylum_brightwellii.AAC.1